MRTNTRDPKMRTSSLIGFLRSRRPENIRLRCAAIARADCLDLAVECGAEFAGELIDGQAISPSASPIAFTPSAIAIVGIFN